jgi:hypothetical protein
MAVFGLVASLAHEENGMTDADMRASLRVADNLDEVIIFRSTGPWSRRWIQRGYPTKNFHVKGKSSDWGPQAGFVPYLGKYSKVGDNPIKAQAGTEANDHGLHDKYASKVQLTLTLDELLVQLNQPEEVPPRRALYGMLRMGQTRDYFLLARRSGDGQIFVFKAEFNPIALNYKIFVYDETYRGSLAAMAGLTPRVLEVMTSSEAGAANKPMTGDYDLMAVCPTWGQYGARSTKAISKAGLDFGRAKGVEAGQTFNAGVNMDAVLDMRTNTGAVSSNIKKTFQGKGAGDLNRAGLAEHGDMGNLTPRILRCINLLNNEMLLGNTPFRRVHHNAESHRNHIFGALVAADMNDPNKKDGFPLTAFHPRRLQAPTSVMRGYGDVATLEDMEEFKAYAQVLQQAGYFLPRNWTWGMSIRDTHRNHIAWR